MGNKENSQNSPDQNTRLDNIARKELLKHFNQKEKTSF
jgi:hypothetical protein